MDGHILAMSPTFHSNGPLGSFQRAQSTPDLLSETRRALSLKSLPSLPAFDVPSLDLDFNADYQVLARPKTAVGDRTAARKVPEPNIVEVETVAVAKQPDRSSRLSRTRSLIDRPRSWLPSSKTGRNISDSIKAATTSRRREDGTDKSPATAAPRPIDRSLSMEHLAELAKGPWKATSRSPSPGIARRPEPQVATREVSADLEEERGEKEEEEEEDTEEGVVYMATRSTTPARIKQLRRHSLPVTVDDSSANASEPVSTPADSPTARGRALSRASAYLTTRLKPRPQSVFVRSTSASAREADPESSQSISSGRPNMFRSRASSQSDSSASTTASSSPSPSSSTSSSSSLSTGPIRASAMDTSRQGWKAGVEQARPASRDPLLASFRELDAGFARFAVNTSSVARMGVIRAILAPFLQRTAHHSSNKDAELLTPEDINRRAGILNKWWTGMLDMLDGWKTAAAGVAAADRPFLLECISTIMVRPEWRRCTSYFQSLDERSPGERVRARSATVGSADAPFTAESAEQSVRTMFVTSLTTQLAVVIDKLCLRNVPPSMATFGGKTLAHAFFFVPGAADALSRLLRPTADLLRRVADEIKLPRRSRGESDDIVALFPPSLGSLGWTSVRAMADKLRRPTKLPSALAGISWHGPWLARWRGGDSDVFFVFCKNFFALAGQFVPAGLPLVEKARAPAFVLVLAQLLSIVDDAVHRYSALQAATEQAGDFALPDISQSADTALLALNPVLPANSLFRTMGEHRVVVMLRDLLSAAPATVAEDVAQTFVESYMAIAQAAAKRTSRYHYGDCLMLCDFLDEALTALRDYDRLTAAAVDWAFWLEVCKMILDSNNALSQVRMLSFVFSQWDILVADPARKEAVCLDWLLGTETFEMLFNNYNPMVRAYYMRLLCWRICRDSGSANELDKQIFLAASNRLGAVWSHYVWLKQAAELSGTHPPSTAPSLPAPGRRFIIIRSEVGIVAQPGLLVSKSSPSLAGGDVSPQPRSAPLDAEDYGAAKADVQSATSPSWRRWSLIGKVLDIASGAAAGAASAASLAVTSDRRSWDDNLVQARREMAASRSLRAAEPLWQEPRPPPPPKSSSVGVSAAASTDSGSSTGSAPVFDACQFVFRFVLGNPAPAGLGSTRPRVLTKPRLPAPAQARARNARVRGAEDAGEDGDNRDESPPPPAAWRPPATRAVSGLLQTGLVSAAGNASERLAEKGRDSLQAGRISPRPPSLSLHLDLSGLDLGDLATPFTDFAPSLSGEAFPPTDAQEERRGRERVRFSMMPAARPTGVYAAGATYTGRALAEWAVVVNECNNFVDRRRDEGVLGLSEVEVPALGIDGSRRWA